MGGYIVRVMLPEFLVIGSMKCGTSAIARGITRHPDVSIARGKELHYFDSNYSKGIEWYLGNFLEPAPGRVRGEATPYLGNEVAMGRLVVSLPDAKMVAILRQPADRAYSHYWHNRRREREPLDFAAALEAERQRLAEGRRIFGYLQLGFYGAQLSDLLRRIPRENLLVVLNEDLRDDREKTLRLVWDHVGVDPDRGEPGEVTRSRRKRMLRGAKAKLKGRDDDERYPPLDKATRDDLTSRYRDDINALEALLERDLSSWL
jgi:hypothetical protein